MGDYTDPDDAPPTFSAVRGLKRYRLTGNYGTFEITKVVEAETEEDAYYETGIMYDLELAGWEFTESPDGEEWEIEEVT